MLPGLGSAYVTQLDAAGDQFESYDGGSIGESRGICVYQRAASGLIGEILVEGSEKTVKVSGEYNIRRLLAPTDSALTLNDGSTREGMSALPSAFWCAEHTVGADGSLASVTFYGGGYGHGVGMSQVGAWKMAESGATYSGDPGALLFRRCDWNHGMRFFHGGAAFWFLAAESEVDGAAADRIDTPAVRP